MINKKFSLMTYNVHSCIGKDGQVSPSRLASVIDQYKPDIIALQELDVRLERTGSIDQAHIIAEYLEMKYHFHPSLYIKEGMYGNAILSSFPMRLIRAGGLPSLPNHRRSLERRGALMVEMEVYGRNIRIINTHLGLNRCERSKQAKTLLGPEWFDRHDGQFSWIICGDLNIISYSSVYKIFRRFLNDAQCMNGSRPQKTFPSRCPLFRLDHVFVDDNIFVHNSIVPLTTYTRMASDHLPLIVELEIL